MIVDFNDSWEDFVRLSSTSKTVKQYLFSIKNELKEKNENFVLNISKAFNDNSSELIKLEKSDLIEHIVAVADYYTEGTYKSGKVRICKNIESSTNFEINDKLTLTDDDIKFINRYKEANLGTFKSFVEDILTIDDNLLIDTMQDNYSNIIEAITLYMLHVYYGAQFTQLSKYGFTKVGFEPRKFGHVCEFCKEKGKAVYDLNDIFNGKAIREKEVHVFCNRELIIPQ